jgi:glucose-1-phosphate cytidylyltransferase
MDCEPFNVGRELFALQNSYQMKTVILCGGRGTRLGEHGAAIPKALLEIGGRPIIWHILKLYSHYELNDFILCLGHLGDKIRSFFESGARESQWQIAMTDTGLETNTGGRINRIRDHLKDDEIICVTYGDGLADIDLKALIDFHINHGRIGTLVAVKPQSGFGVLELEADDIVVEFREKPPLDHWVNGGFFVFNRQIFDYLNDDMVLEREPLEELVKRRQLVAYRHSGFWKCLDTYKDYLELNQMYDSGQAAWKVWSTE